jgi:uncharacterized membrane protein YfcA
MHFESLGWLLPLAALLTAGLLAGFAAGMFGIGGGFMVVPAMLLVLPLLGGMKGEYAHVAVGTSAATIIVASLRSVTAHARRGAVDFLAGHVDGRGLLLIFAIGVLLMSVNFLVPRLSEIVISEQMPSGLAVVAIAAPLGAFSSLLGIGGGTIAITVMTWCSRTIHRAIATASGIGTLIAAPTAVGFAIIGFGRPGLPWGSIGYVNVPAALAISSMSILTAPLGVAAAHRLPAAPLKRVFGVYLVVISAFMFKNALKG